MNSTNIDVLNCSREDLEKLSDSELESLLKFTQDKSNEYHILQISLKTLITLCISLGTVYIAILYMKARFINK